MTAITKFIFQEKIISPIIIIIISILFLKITTALINKIFTKGKDSYEMKKRTTIIELVTNVLKFFIYAIAIMMILDVYGVDTNGIIASLGIAGVVLGLALQSTVQDLMSGITIILDNFYVIGDIIRVNDFTGEVIDLGLKSTKVRSANGEIYIFSNRNVDSVVNLSQARAGVKIEVPTAYEEKTEKVEEVLKNVIEKIKKMPDVYKDSTYLGIEKLDNSAINYAIIIYCKSSEQWAIKRASLKIIKEAYEKNNIKIPYDQIEVHNGKESI